MILPVPCVLAGVGLLLMATSIPLALRKAPMNRWYGVRTRKAYGGGLPAIRAFDRRLPEG